jgi:hypothetical protein
MPRWRAMYVSVNKAACTSLKWLVADVQGEDRERFYGSLSSELSRTMTIHRRDLWEHTPMAREMAAEELAAISPDDGWFVFGVVRHPTARLFSAWQSKLLLREPWWVAQFGDADWFPRIPRTGEDIVEDFTRFARSIAREPEQVIRNRHFAPQRRLLAAGRMRYSRIYRTSELAQLLEDFEHHLRARGWAGERLALLRTNETPLPAIPAVFGPEVLDASRTLYKVDFEAFGYEDGLPGALDPSDGYSDPAVAEIARLIERSERIGDLSRRAVKLRLDLKESATAPSTVLLRRIAWRAKRSVLQRLGLDERQQPDANE